MVALHLGLRHVLFASWRVEPAAVEPRLPAGLAVDVLDGAAWLSVVAFVAVDVRPARLPVPGLAVPQVNLRTYVRRGDDPGVHFLSLDAGSAASVLVGRLLRGLPYHYARIVRTVEPDAGGDGRDASERGDSGLEESVRDDPDGLPVAERVRFASRRWHPGARPARLRAVYGPAGDRFEAEPGTPAAFLAERYRYYAAGPRGALRCADLRHAPWPLYPADARFEENGLFAACGFDRPEGEPVCHYSPGVDAVAGRSRRA